MGIPGEFGFLKKNELFVGRVAMLGFAAELVGEVCSARRQCIHARHHMQGPYSLTNSCTYIEMLLHYMR